MRLMQVITTMCCIQIVHEIPNGCTRIGRKYQKMSTLCEHSEIIGYVIRETNQPTQKILAGSHRLPGTLEPQIRCLRNAT